MKKCLKIVVCANPNVYMVIGDTLFKNLTNFDGLKNSFAVIVINSTIRIFWRIFWCKRVSGLLSAKGDRSWLMEV